MEKELILECSSFFQKCSVNSFKLYEWHQIIEGESFSLKLYNELVDYFAADVLQTGNSLASSNNDLRLIFFLEKELYNVLSSGKNRGKAELLTSSLISAAATSVANMLNVDVFITTGLANLIVLGVIKMGINAWCRYFEEKYKEE